MILILLLVSVLGALFCTGSNPMLQLPSEPNVSSISASSNVNIKIQFVNNSGIAANRIHVVIRGLNKSKNPGYFDLTKDPILWVQTGSYDVMPASVPDVTLDKILAKNNGVITVPYNDSGRVYLAIDNRIYDESQLPAWVKRNQANDVSFDKFELAVVDWGEGPNLNLTQVDFFNIPLKIETGGQVRGFKDGITRKQIFDEYLAAVKNLTGIDSDWQKLIIQSGGKNMRILNPGKIVPDDTDFPNLRKYFDDLIKEYWKAGKTFNLLLGDGKVVVCTADGNKITAPGFGKYNKVTSVAMFGQEVHEGNDPDFIRWISSAINRGVIQYQDNAAIRNQGNSNMFYGNSSSVNRNLYNYYSEFFHRDKYVYDNRAYALAFDDVFGRDSKLDIPIGSTITVTIQPFGGE